MYTPGYFQVDDREEILAFLRDCAFANLVTCGNEGIVSTPLPLFVEEEGDALVLHGHIAKANDQWKRTTSHDALVIFQGPDAYISPSWYETKKQNGMVVPTWNYVAVHAYGPVEFYHDEERLLQVVSRLTKIHEDGRPQAWSIEDAPESFIRSQLRGIVGVRIPVVRLEAKKKMSQNRSAADRASVIEGLASSDSSKDRVVAKLVRP